MLTPRKHDSVIYDQFFCRDLADSLDHQSSIATAIGNLPVATLFQRSATALRLYATDLAEPGNTYIEPPKPEKL